MKVFSVIIAGIFFSVLSVFWAVMLAVFRLPEAARGQMYLSSSAIIFKTSFLSLPQTDKSDHLIRSYTFFHSQFQ